MKEIVGKDEGQRLTPKHLPAQQLGRNLEKMLSDGSTQILLKGPLAEDKAQNGRESFWLQSCETDALKCFESDSSHSEGLSGAPLSYCHTISRKRLRSHPLKTTLSYLYSIFRSSCTFLDDGTKKVYGCS